MEFQELYSKLSNGKLAPPAHKKRWEEASDRICVHAKGIRPQFVNQRNRKGEWVRGAGGLVTPANYEERYQYLFDNYILNRHPNEQEEHYQFRLSVYPLLAKEVYLKGKAQVGGSIFQTSQYTIAANDEAGQQYLDGIEFDKNIREKYFEHILTDPYGKFAIVEGHFSEFGTDEPAQPVIEIVESRHIMHYDGESILFCAQEKVQGRKLLYFLDRGICVKLLQSDDRKKWSYDVVAVYQHNLGVLPVVDNGKYLFEPFVTWADLIARNFSDDEIVAKNNNYPHIQMVESTCDKCQGGGTAPIPCDTCDGGFEEGVCDKCSGRGTISRNPGEIIVFKENQMLPSERGMQMPKMLEFINPDVAISKNSFERCWKIYEAGLRSLHLKHTEEAQSGVAKAIDREQLYLLISTVSNHIFYIADKLLMFVFGYLDMGISEQKPYTIEQPTQFQIKTESDIQDEMIALKDADLSVRRQKTDEYMQVVYSGNAVELKKWNVVKVWDDLYCMTSDDINSAKLNGGATNEDVLRHTKAEKLLNRLVLVKGKEWFINASIQEITDILDTELAAITPQLVNMPEIVV